MRIPDGEVSCVKLLALVGLPFISTTALAQGDPPIGQDIQSKASQVDTGATPEFSDPGNATAKAIAANLGISVGDATSRLRVQVRAAKLSEQLSQRFPDTFAGTFWIVGSPSAHMSLEGDSGGPVVAGSIAYGWTHGKLGWLAYYRNAYTAAYTVYQTTNLRMIVCTTNC